MNKRFLNALILAGLLSVITLPQVKADERLIMTGSTDLNNGLTGITTTNNGNGGAVQNNGYVLNILQGEFSNNTLSNDTGAVFGGAIYQINGELNISNGVTFNGNSVKSRNQTYPGWEGADSASGGAIYISGADAVLNTTGTVTFSNNKALAIGENDQSNGGALYIESIKSAVFENVNFTGNSSKTRGGAIYNGDTQLAINGKAVFEGNSSARGGAIYNYEYNNAATVSTGTGSEFSRNEALENGGAIANFDGTINVGKNNSFTENKATNNGGAIYNANYSKTAETNIAGGTTFNKNEAGKGGAIYNSGTVKLNTSEGNITFSENTANSGKDIYLDGETSQVLIEGSNETNKVSFGSGDSSIAGNGTITNSSSGIVEFINNNDVSGFTGKYIQTNGTTSLNNSTIFNNFDIQSGALELLNGSTAAIDGVNHKFNGSSLLISGSTLNLSADINKDVSINLGTDGTININNGSLTLNTDNTRGTVNGSDTWEGDINTTGNGSLILDDFTHDTAAGGNYTQDGGNLVLQNGSDLTLGNNESTVSGGNISIGNDSTLTVENGSSISGDTATNVSGEMNVGNGGTVTGGTTTVENGGNLNVNQNGQISGNANTTIEAGGKVTVDGGTINSDGKTDIQAGSELEIKNDGDVTLHKGDNWEGTITNNDSSLTLDNITHNTENGAYVQNGGELNLNNGSDLTLGENGSITDGNVNINNSDFTIADGGQVTGGQINVNDGSNFQIEQGGIMSGGNVSFGDNVNIGVDGTVLADAVFDVTKNTVEITENGSITLNKDEVTGDQWTDGTIHLNGGELNFKGINNDKNGTFLGDKGGLTIGDKFYIEGDSYISSDVTTTITSDGILSQSGGNVSLNQNTSWEGKVDVSGGELNLDNVNKDGVLAQSDGTTNITGSFNMNKADDNISGGKLNIGTAEGAGNLNQTAGTIGSDAKVTIQNDSSLNISGGETTLNGSGEGADNWYGTVGSAPPPTGGTEGTLNLNNITSNGTLITTGGNLNINDSTLTIGNSSSIGKDTNVDFGQSSTINLTGGKVSFDGGEWKGTVNLKDGTLDYSGTQNGTLHGTGGNLNTEDGSTLTIGAGSYIENAVNADIKGNLVISGTDSENIGHVDLNNGDKITGDITIENNGVLNLGDNVAMAEDGQTITLNGANAEMNLTGNNNLDIKAEITGSSGEINKEGSGNVTFTGTTSNYEGNLTVNNSGNLTFTDADGFGGNLIFGDIEGESIGIIADTVKGSTTLDKDAEITYSTYRDVDLKFGNTVSVSQGTITALAKDGQNVIFENDAKASNDGELDAIGTNVTFTNGAAAENGGTIGVIASEDAVMNNVTASNDSIIGTIAGNTIFNDLKLSNSDLYIMQNGFTANSTTIDGSSSFNLMNGTITDNILGNTQLDNDGTGSFTIDISARDWDSDKFIADAISGGGTLNVSDFQFIGKCPIDRHVALKIFNYDTLKGEVSFTATDKEVFTPIGYYRLYSQGGGNYTASLTRYNPQVFRGQVSTVAMYQNQLVVNNALFDHVQEVNMQYLAQQNANKYAAAYPQFAPYQYNKKDGSLWYKAFGTFEKLGMTQGLNVNNNFYGALVGADFPAVELKHGWTLLPTAYVGYMGAHQTFANMSMYQNGGQLGGMATFMKNDFIGSVLAYGGGYGNDMNVAGYTDTTGNWFAGTAAKVAYNFHPAKHFVIQPTLLASYNAFGGQRWHTDFGDMSMRANMLNGVNVAPGINFIYGRETWSVYATVQYFYNILGYSTGRAGNVDLPGVEMRHGFLEYGIGVTKSWKDRFSGYLQIVLRNGGRTGIGFQGGLMYRL